MKKFMRILSVCLSLALLLLLIGCGSNSGDAFIYFELENKPKTLDPQLVSTREESVIVRSIFDTLLRYNESGEIVVCAAEKYTKEDLKYTFKIKSGATWTNGDKLTAYDFEYGLKRGLDPATKAPAAATLDSIKSVSATDSSTLVITLSYDDPDFLHTMTSPISMPCNEKLFKASKGRYGLELDHTPACGSYYIKKWTDSDKFLIRLAKNLDYKGYFEARNMRVYFTCDKRSNLTMLLEEDTDFAFLSADEAKKASTEKIPLTHIQNSTGLLFINPNLNENVRLSLMKSIKLSPDTFSPLFGASTALSIAPAVIDQGSDFSKAFPYDIDSATELYKAAVMKDPLLSLNGAKIKCYNDPAALAAAKAIAAHWQQKLGSFVNIEETSSLSALRSAYKNGDYTLLIMPMDASFAHTGSYLSGFNTDETTVESAQQALGSASLCYPLYNQSSYTAHLSYITNAKSIAPSGIIDVALAVKEN